MAILKPVVLSGDALILSNSKAAKNFQVKTLPLTLIRNRPWILRPDTTLIKFWDLVVVFFLVVIAITFPVVMAFVRDLNAGMYMFMIFTRFLYGFDVYIQCTTAIERDDHFTYIDSIREIVWYRLKSPQFYFDILSTYVLDIYAELIWPSHLGYMMLILSLNVLLKMWRILIYMKQQEENMHNNLLVIITIKYIICFGIMITWGAVMLYVEARPGDNYNKQRWYYKKELAVDHPILISPATVSFYFATVTGFQLGYGDIVPTSITDCVVVIICLITGYIVIISCVTEASSVFKHTARIRTNFQEELFAVDRFMIEHNIFKEKRQSVRNYMKLQWDHDKGFSIKQLIQEKEGSNIQWRIMVLELSKTFYCVPQFRTSEPRFLKLLAKLCKVRVLPPREILLNKGSYVREMYIIEHGYCEVKKETPNSAMRKVVGPITPLGFVDMVLGQENQFRVETLTHIRVLCLSYSSYTQAVTQYPEIKMEIDEALKKNNEDGGLSFSSDEVMEEKEENMLQQQRQILMKPFIQVAKYDKFHYIRYVEPFKAWGKLQLLGYLLMPISILPNSIFMKVWTAIRIIKAAVIGVIAPIQFSVLPDTHFFMKIIISLQITSAIDMYFCFHLAYYDNQGILIFHPAKTSLRYLKGPFIMDFLSVFPFYWLMNYLYSSSEHHRFFIKSLAIIMLLQLYNFIQAFQSLEKDILRRTGVVKTLKLLPIVIMVINFITGLVLLLQCFKISTSNIPELEGTTRLAQELVESISLFCRFGNNSTQDESEVYKMYFMTLYWVTATITVCGFGDIYANNEASMIVVILILTLGILFFSYVFSSITSSMVNTNIIISKHRKRILRVNRVMKKNNVDPLLRQRLILHYKYNWKRTEGESPQRIFSYIHAGLAERIVSSMYESMFALNPIFKNYENIIVSIIAKHLEELYFLQGETIVKHRDILEHIYLIYRGEVQIISRRGAFSLTMGCAGMFGNISNKPFHLSRETVIASENVDLIRLNRKDFFSELASFPNTKSLIDFLTSRREDYIRPKAGGTVENYTLKLNIYRLQSVPIDSRGTTSSHIYMISGFALNNSVFFLRFHPLTSFVILPGTKLHQGIEIYTFVIAFLSSILTMYVFAFQDFSIPVLVVLYVLDALFAVEIYLQFHITDADMFGDCIVKTDKIKKKYLKSRKLFYDLATNFPFEVFLFATPRNWWYKSLSILHLNRVFRLRYIFEFYDAKNKELMTNKIYLEIGWIIVMFFLLIHTLGCVWFFATCPLGFCFEPSWVTEMNLLGLMPWEYYIYSTFHIVVITTSTGLQKLQIYSIPEVTLTVFFMITCRYAVVLESGLLAATINADTYNFFMFQQNLIELKEIYKSLRISNYQLEKIMHYMSTLWQREHGKQMPKYLVKAPYTLKCEILTAMYGRHLSQSYIFSVADVAFLRQLASFLKRFLYFAGNYIVQQGDIDHTMYFIHKGEVAVMTIHPELIETVHITLKDNDNFGVQQGLILGTPHDFSYRAESDSEILSLTYTDWSHLLKYYPDDATKINTRLTTLPLIVK